MSVLETPRLIDGGLAIDERGEIAFVNGFRFEGVKRFYVVKNHRPGCVRAWQAHRHEAKYVIAIGGEALVAAVAVDDWSVPSKSAAIHRYELSAKKPALLFIPPGYANGSMSLNAEAQIIFFSTSTLEESKADDVRYDARHWDIWTLDGR
jgi:dTDP-4-dehydrorhamnose 3,5-epimerase-like enzyme